jgi:hypothetical protein
MAGGVAPLVLVTLVAPPDPALVSPSTARRRVQVGDVGAAVIGRSGVRCAVEWWGAGCEASVHWSDVAVVNPFQTWMALPVVGHARWGPEITLRVEVSLVDLC